MVHKLFWIHNYNKDIFNQEDIIKLIRVDYMYKPFYNFQIYVHVWIAQWNISIQLTFVNKLYLNFHWNKMWSIVIDDDFRDVDYDWLHLDQGVCREGLHSYQAAVCLEEQTVDDYCFRVLSKSHLYHSEFFQTFPNAAKKTKRFEFYKMFKKQKEFFYNKGCKIESVPVPKGGIVLWDSRTAHDNAPPIATRANPHRWRFVVFVSMTPAIWANEKDMAFRKDAYQRMLLTTHWSSQGLKTFPEYKGNKRKRNPVNVSIDVLPEAARTQEARLLAGDKRYDFEDGKPNGPAAPKWRFGGYENFGTGW